MGRHYVVLDGPGYYRCSEPGYHFFITGDEWLRKVTTVAGRPETSPRLLWNPPGTEWVLPLPLQVGPGWYNDLTLDKYVLTSAMWTFASGITPLSFEWGTRLPDGTSSPENLGVAIPRIPSGVTSLDTTSYTALESAAGINLPADMATVAIAGTAPNGRPLSEADYHPYFAWGAYPAPHDTLVFGFAQFALILFRSALYVLSSPQNDRQTWKLLHRVDLKKPPTGIRVPSAVESFSGSVVSTAPGGLAQRALIVCPVGPDHLHIDCFGVSALVEARKSSDPLTQARLFKPGNWWIGAPEGAKVAFQAQVVGYNPLGFLSPLGAPSLFDLGTYYKPTAAPEQSVGFRFGGCDGLALTSGIDGDGFNYTEETASRQRITWGLTDELGDPRASDGTHSEGNLNLILSGGHVGATDSPSSDFYLAPQFRRFDLRFPPVLTARAHSTLILNDLQFAKWEGEATLREADGKRFHVDLFDGGVAALSASGHDRREGYPLEVWEDLNGDGTLDVLRLAGWLESPDLTLVRVRSGGQPFLTYRMSGRALLSRGNDKNGMWEFLPFMVDPTSPGTVEHSFIVRECVHQTGFDVTDPLRFVAHTDPFSGTALARIPETWGLTNGASGIDHSKSYQPQWSQARIPYAEEIATRFRGWILREYLNGFIEYGPDPALWIQDYGAYTVSCALYPDHARATLAGVPGQCYEAEACRVMESPKANTIRLSANPGAADFIPQVIDRDLRGITDPTYANYLGEPRVYGEIIEAAYSVKALKALARVALARLKRRKTQWTVTVPTLAPWEMGPGEPYLGGVIRIYDALTYGDYLVNAIAVEHVKRGLHRTQFTVELVPPQG